MMSIFSLSRDMLSLPFHDSTQKSFSLPRLVSLTIGKINQPLFHVSFTAISAALRPQTNTVTASNSLVPFPH